jgi:hypothetical protein
LSEGEVAAMEAYYRTLGARMREKAKGSVD